LTRLVILLAVANEQERGEVRSESDTAPRSGQPTQGVGSQQRRDQVRTEIRDVSFPIAVRGYERHAVDAYIERVNRVIAELEVGSSPQASVRHALDRVGEQIGDVLQHARQAAEEITAVALAEAEATTAKARTEAEQIMEDAELQAHQLRARAKQQADEMLARAREQAAELMLGAEEQARTVQEQAEPRLRELEADTEAVWDARRKLLEDLPRMATELMEIAGTATARLRRPPGTGGAPAQSGQPRPEGSPVEAGAGAETRAGAARWARPGAGPAHRT
jgi:DivIVA domain-containing protein